MNDWISAETPPEEDGTYIVCEDMTGVSVFRDGQWEPWPETYLIELCCLDEELRDWMATGQANILYWQPLPGPPLAQMIWDRLADGMWFLVPGEDET